MKKIILALLLVLSCLLPSAFATPSGYGVEVTEVDGSPLVGAARVAFPNGTVSCANGICTLTLAGRERIELTADTVLTAAQSRGTFVTNQGSSGEVDLTLDALSEGATCTLIVEEAQIIELCPPTDELFDLDGTALDANDCVDSPAVVGSKLVATRMKIASGAWRWSLDTVRGSWTDTGASD